MHSRPPARVVRRAPSTALATSLPPKTTCLGPAALVELVLLGSVHANALPREFGPFLGDDVFGTDSS